MKRNIIIFFANMIILFSSVGIFVNFSPALKPEILFFQKGANKICSSYDTAKTVSSNISLTISKKSEDNTNTAEEETESVMKSTKTVEVTDDTDLTSTPSDIEALMKEAEKTIESEKVKGKTSEDNYLGGGTIVSFGKVEIQDKIPTSFYNPDIESLLSKKANLSLSDLSKPTVLIYHSHSTESYTLLDCGYYTESTDLKTKDKSRNMIRVGDEICKVLTDNGINVIHDTDIHDSSYNESYASSRKSVEDYLEKYPSIEITIDVHRDDITYSDKTKVKPTAKINGKKAARMMLISGCEYGLVKSFPSWEENLRFSLSVENKLCNMYDGLMRPVLFSQRRYNMDLTPNSFLLEIGTSANTLDEACYSGRLFANGLAQLLKEEYIKE